MLRRLPAYSKLAWALVRDRRVRRRYRLLVLGGIGYLVSPIDLIPGFIPILGQLDDLTVVLWSLRLALRAAPAEVADSHLAAHGLSWQQLDEDLARLRRAGFQITRGVAHAGMWAASRAATIVMHLGRRIFRR